MKEGNENCILMIGESAIPECRSTIIQITDFDWNDVLTPWPSKKVFKGADDFGGHASILLEYIKALDLKQYQHVSIVGYSLAGLFALYACMNLDIFEGCACCSSSFWYPDFVEYVKQHPIRNRFVYLSLGDKEKNSRNPFLSKVEVCTNEIYEILKKDNTCFFEMNEGNHFKDVDTRIEKGVLWLENSFSRCRRIDVCVL